MELFDVGDVHLEYELVGAGPELVFLHGLTGGVEMDRRMAQALGEHFRVLWYSSRGHGRSTEPAQLSGWGYDVIARDLDLLIDHVGFDRPFLVGVSHGANTIMRHAIEFPGRASAAALIGPGGNALARPPAWKYTVMRLIGWANRKRHGDDWLVRLVTGMRSDAAGQDPETVAAARAHDLPRLARAMRHIPDQQVADPHRLAGSDLRCVVAAWEDDPIIHPIALARQIAEVMPSARFEEIEPFLEEPVDHQVGYAVERIVDWHAELTADLTGSEPAS